ncbi:hypothetical protein G7Y89_g12915 [Cudoniella acicularis]|uniref:NAD(P)-binding protein n=1 Tax=Cudoniella acicularis TaxID=354080 RepID=A0A8H4RAJ2_9HELO|nr:hypothetical protein G7Y89_g12915 [Cudoniella acicularis]
MSASKTIVLITGANGGIGYLTAQALITSSPNYHVIIGSRSLTKGETAVTELQKTSPKSTVSVIQLDVTDEQSIANAAAQVEKEHGRLDVLINNAGIISHAQKLIDSLRETFETNTFGAAVTTEIFAPLLLKSKSPKLIYVTSELGSLAMRADSTNTHYNLPATAYRMSKAAMNMLMLCDVQKYGGKGLKAWAFNPEYVVTNLSGTGEKGREERIKNGAGDAAESARGIREIVEGKRDGDAGKFIFKDGVHEW